MVTKKLTALTVKNAKPKWRAGKLVRNEIADAGSGLYHMVQPSGAHGWALRYRINRKTRKFTLVCDADPTGKSLAEVGVMLTAARSEAAALLHRIEQGIDPAAEQRAAAAAETRQPVETDSVEAQVAQFLELHAKRKTRPITYQNTAGIFNNKVVPAWRGRSVYELRRRDAIALVDAIAASGHGVMANRALTALSRFGTWLVRRDVLTVSPFAGIERPHKETARERTLSSAEFTALWAACADEPLFGPFIRVLMLTGCRRGEAAGMRWSEIDTERRLWLLPSTRTKNKRPHVIPLAPLAWDTITNMPRLAGDFVFSVDGTRPIAGFHHIKTRLDAKLNFAQPWTLHDVRRSVASGLQRLGTRVELIEKTLNHVSGSYRGIVGTYQRDQLLEERRAALANWATHIESLVIGQPAPDKVVQLHGRGR
jgi:integrase